MTKPLEKVYNVIMFGESAVGKTTLIMRYFYKKLFIEQKDRYDKDIFSNQHFTTLGSEFVLKKLTVENNEIILKIWDTAGQERFMTITKSFYKQAHGIFLVFDVTNQDSFLKLDNWIHNIEENANSEIPKFLIANKIDLTADRLIAKEMGEIYAKKHQLKYIETSAKTNTGINEMFYEMASQINENGVDICNDSVVLKQESHNKPKTSTCC